MHRRLLTLARDSRLALAATILSGFLAGLLTIGQAAGLSRVVDGVFLDGKTLGDVAGLIRLLLLIVCLRAGLAWLNEVSAVTVAVRVKGDLRRRLFEKILRMGPAYTRGERTGELTNAAVEGVEALDAYFSQYLPQLVLAALVPLSILVTVFPHDPLSGVVLLLTAPLIPVFMYLIGKTAETLTKRQWDTLSRLSAHFYESLQGLTTLKELGRSREHARSIAESSERFRDVTLTVLRVTFLSALVLELVATISTAIVAVEVGLRLLYGHMEFQEALFLLLLAPEFYLPLRMLGLRFHAGMSGTTAAKRIFEILDLPEKTGQDRAPSTGEPQPFSRLSISNLTYTYPGESQPALEKVSLEIRAGEHVALVGPSGAGKSTLASVLLRFVEPDSGSIRVDGRRLAEIPMPAWREQIAWVPQNPHLFHDTIAANLRLADPQATEAQLRAAARSAHLDGFIESLPDGYATVVGEDGARLSGGQAQRLTLARAFLKNPALLILDEPTSNLDPGNESLLDESLSRLMQGRTVITIAHRLNTTFTADRIYILDKGRLVESGRHEELLARNGLYARLVRPVGNLPSLISFPRHSRNNHRFEDAVVLPTEVRPASSNHRPVLLRLLAFLKGSWGWVALSVLLGFLTVGSNVGLMGTSAFLISAAALHPGLGALEVAIVGVRFFGLSRGAFRYGERLSSHTVTFNLLARLRAWFYARLEPLAPARLMQYRSGDLLNRIVTDIAGLENFYVRVVAPPLVAGLIAAGMSLYFAAYEPLLAWTYLAFLAFLGLGVPALSWSLSRRPGAELVTRRAGLQARLVDGIQGLPDLLVFGRGRDFVEGLMKDGKAFASTQRRLAFLNGLSTALTTLLVNAGMLAILALAIPEVVDGRLPGVMLAVLTLAALAGFEAIMPLPLAAQTLASSLQSARRLFEIVDADPAVVDPPAAAPVRSARPMLQFDRVAFSYPGNPQPAIRELDLAVQFGQKLAIVGPSGAGKSSLANLLLRYWDVSGGRILLDGRDLREFAQADVRSLFSVLSQRPFFFSGSVLQNLLLARPSATRSEVEAAARKAHIHEFISGLPKGYETAIGERGFRLSGGERQRLAIARALLKNAPILLLDEPTANLDPVTERSILDELHVLAKDRTLLLITHRLIGLERMDEILVLDRGRIVERGTHEDLSRSGGLYGFLWNLQNRIIPDEIAS